MGTPGSKVVYFTANPNGEAEIIKITLDPVDKIKRMNIFMEKDFSKILIKGRASKGNLLSKKTINRIGLKSHGHSTLGGRKVWFDPDVNRLNYDDHGTLLGEFYDEDTILVILKNGEYYQTDFNVNNHYEDNISRIEKFDAGKVWTAVLFDADNDGYPYIKRFLMEPSKRHQSFIGENPASRLIFLTDQFYPRAKVTFGGADATRPPLEIDIEQFIAVKGFKAKGKRITTWNVESIEELEPVRWPETSGEEETEDGNDEKNPQTQDLDPDAGKSERQIIDEITGQLSLFDDNDTNT